MTDSLIQGKSNFLKAVFNKEYESDKKLPDVMNLLERFNDGNTVLHYCAQNNYLTTFEKILDCSHPAVGLLIECKNRDDYTALDLLLKCTALTNERLDIFLEKMQNRSLSDRFFGMLKSSLIRMESSDYNYNPLLKSSIVKFYKGADEEVLITAQNQTYTPTYYPREPLAVPVTSLGCALTVNQRVNISLIK